MGRLGTGSGVFALSFLLGATAQAAMPHGPGTDDWAGGGDEAMRRPSAESIEIAQTSTVTAEDVRMLQLTLDALGFDAGIADGIMGAQTRAALRQFQSAYGVAPTGVMDPATQEAINRAISGRAALEQPLEGATVSREIQAYHHDISQERFADLEVSLAALGYDPGDADGLVTEQTQQAIAAFQADHGLEVTGLIDINTEAGITEIHADQIYAD